jgi:serine protease inhibitor
MNSLTTTETAVSPLVQSNTEFALALYDRLRTAEGNLFFSPYSISTALAMTYAGARGETAVQMAQTLRFQLDEAVLHPAFGHLEAMLNEIEQKGDIHLRVANALWPHVKYKFLPEYLALLAKYYGTSVTTVDYAQQAEAARQAINAWVEEKTADKIKNLIPAGVLDALTRLVLVNAVYFKGNWASQFEPDLTEEQPFWLSTGEAVDAPLMRQTGEYGYAERDDLQILELPYIGRDLSMIVLLPRENDGLVDLQEKLTAANLTRWTDRLWPTEVEVLLPKFKLTFALPLNEVLQKMGIVDAFSMDRANFSGMDGCEDCLYIAAIFHKAFVEVNEEGTEAAAATAVVMKLRSAPPQPPPTFRADHPFLFLIRENNTGSILFWGRVTNPAQ